MAIGTTGSVDPVTGERTESQFSYTPVDPQEDAIRQAFQQSQQAFYPPPPQPRGPTPYWENPETYYPQQQQIDPIAQAKAATMAAQKFIAFRGYQADLKEGMAAADAFAKWGPMLVADTSFGPSMKAFQGQAKPVWTPENPRTGQPGAFSGGKVQFAPSPAKPPTSIQEVDEIQKTETAMRQALASGNQELAKSLQERAALLREQLKGQETSVGYDDQGRLQVRIGKGGTPTVATQSQAQQKLIKYENTMELMSRLKNVLKPEHVGVRGVGGEWIVDKGLQQLAEMGGMRDVASEGRIKSRKLIIAMREGMLREISGDPRFSNVDREEISRALPSNGAFESYKDAKIAMDEVRSIIVQRSKAYAKAIGAEPPVWTLNPEEIKTSYKAGKMTLDEAKNALTRFH